MVSGCIVDNASVPLFRAAALARVGPYLTRAEQGGAQGCEDWDLYIRIAETFSIRLVPEFLVAYREDRLQYECQRRKLMAASFSVVMQRARQRNPAFAGSDLSSLGPQFLSRTSQVGLMTPGVSTT